MFTDTNLLKKVSNFANFSLRTDISLGLEYLFASWRIRMAFKRQGMRHTCIQIRSLFTHDSILVDTLYSYSLNMASSHAITKF